MKTSDGETKLKAQGTVDGEPAVSGRLVLAHYNLADTNPNWAPTDLATKKEMRKLFALLWENNRPDR
jgi:hypothetical protein